MASRFHVGVVGDRPGLGASPGADALRRLMRLNVPAPLFPRSPSAPLPYSLPLRPQDLGSRRKLSLLPMLPHSQLQCSGESEQSRYTAAPPCSTAPSHPLLNNSKVRHYSFLAPFMLVEADGRRGSKAAVRACRQGFLFVDGRYCFSFATISKKRASKHSSSRVSHSQTSIGVQPIAKT